MTTFYYQPQASEVGTLPSIFSSNGSGSPWPDIQVVDAGGGTYVLRFVGTAYGPVRNAVLSEAGTPGVFADGEIYVKLKMAEFAILSAQVRSGGAGSSSALFTYYSAALDGRGSGNIRLKDTALNAGSYIRDNEILTKGSAVGVFLHLMVKVSGTTISVKMWKDGESEPAYSTYTDSTLTSGYAALMTGEGTSDVYFIGVGTGTDAAPRSAGVASNQTVISATLANITGSVASKSNPKTAISATLANVSASITSGSGSLKTTITTTLGNIVGAITSTGNTTNGTFTSEVLKDYAGNVLANVSLNYVRFYNDTTGALVLNKTGVTTNASGIVTFSDAALVAGTTYRVDWETSAGSRRMPRKAAA